MSMNDPGLYNCLSFYNWVDDANTIYKAFTNQLTLQEISKYALKQRINYFGGYSPQQKEALRALVSILS